MSCGQNALDGEPPARMRNASRVYLRQCVKCGINFYMRYRAGGKYCKNCGHRARGSSGPRKPPNRICHKCGKHFRAPPSDPQRYCSYACHLASGGAQRAGAAAKSAISGYGAKKDANHSQIVKALEQMGIWYADMSERGGGMPDLLVHCGGQLHWVEIKNPATSYGRRGLNNLQRIFADNWGGGQKVHIVRSLDDLNAWVRNHGWAPGAPRGDPVISVRTPQEALKAVGL